MKSKYNWEYSLDTNDPTSETITDFINTVYCGTVNCETLNATDDVVVIFSSDARLKEDVDCIDSQKARTILQMLRPVFFRWNRKAREMNSKKDDRIKTGLIAQEVQKVMPDLVQENSKGYLTVDYIQIISLLIAAIKKG